MKYSLSEKIETRQKKNKFKKLNLTIEIESMREIDFLVALFNKSDESFVKLVNEEVGWVECRKFTTSIFNNFFDTWVLLENKIRRG